MKFKKQAFYVVLSFFLALQAQTQTNTTNQTTPTRKTIKLPNNRAKEIPIGEYQASWESLKNYETPDWYLDAKFGIFLHWGLYSVPAYAS